MVTTMLLIGMAALNTAAPLLYMMFSMMCSFFILSAFLATNTMRGVRLTRRVPRVWQAQQPLRVELRAENRKRLTSSYSLRVKDMMTGGKISGTAFFDRIPPKGQELSQDYEFCFLRRGVYHFERLEIATRFPFGLIERSISWEAPQEILVLPQSISVDSVMDQARSELGDFESQKKGQGSGLYGLRAYSPEFTARDIHWKISARRGTLIVREYESEERRRATVILDNRFGGETTAEAVEAFEKAVILATSVIEWLCEHAHEVELRTATGIVGFGTGQAHLTRCRRALAQLELIEPAAGNTAYLEGGEAGVTRFPILLGGKATGSAGVFPVSVGQLDEELSKALREGYKPRRGKVIAAG